MRTKNDFCFHESNYPSEDIGLQGDFPCATLTVPPPKH